MRHGATKEEITATRTAVAALEAALKRLRDDQAKTKAEQEEARALDEFVRIEPGSFDPRSDPGRVERYLHARVRLDLLVPWFGRQMYLRPGTELLLAPMNALLDCLRALCEPKVETVAFAMNYYNRTDPLESSAEQLLGMAAQALARVMPWVSPDFAGQQFTGDWVGQFLAAAKPYVESAT